MFNSGNSRSRDAVITTVPSSSTTSSSSHSSNSKRGMFSVIGPDISINGNIAATADLHIDGAVDGNVTCGTLVQGTESRITGSVHADAARLSGTIEGTVCVRQLTIERAARISGDVEYDTITIESGASLDGRLKRISPNAVRPTSFTPEEPVRLIATDAA